MSNFVAVLTGLALASILVAAVSVRRDEARPSKPVVEARLEVPVPPKADRLPMPVVDQSKLFGQPAMGHAGRLWLLDVPNSGFDSRDGRQEQPATPVAIERIEPAPSTNRRASNCRDDCKRPGADPDPVCGPRGRTWYVKDNGWKYWRCNR
jgi:hypothetical protein